VCFMDMNVSYDDDFDDNDDDFDDNDYDLDN
jgi:hypothetical protein